MENIVIFAHFSIQHVVWQFTKKLPWRVVIICVVTGVFIRVLPVAWWVGISETILVEALNLEVFVLVDGVKLVTFSSKLKELAVGVHGGVVICDYNKLFWVQSLDECV